MKIPPLQRQRVSVQDICAAYGVSRAKVEGLIRAGYLTTEHLPGGHKRYFSMVQVEGLFRPAQCPSPIDLRTIAELTTAQVGGAPPRNAHKQMPHKGGAASCNE